MLTGTCCDATFVLVRNECGVVHACVWSRGEMLAEEFFPNWQKAMRASARVVGPLQIRWVRS